eukprot:c13988_g1_i1.p1 GENE.c13988_g1_i1~~c13988_g1_i1.p1  ORF type:complete len:532 (+),score=92.56 c13988_g1_i1:40-1635(+)
MIYPRDSIHDAYLKIKTTAHETGGQTVVIFAAVDCDSICASQILKGLLRADYIPYSLKPVIGYSDLKEAVAQQIQNNADLRSIILINCGGSINIKAFLELENEALDVYIVDSHRPVHLENAFSVEKVWVFDGGASMKDAQSMQEIYFSWIRFFEGQEDNDLSSDDSDSDSEPSKHGDDEESDEEARRPAKRRKKNGDARREAMKEARRRMQEYYARASSGLPVTAYFWTLAVSLSRDSLALLWLSIVGITDEYLQDRLPQAQYDLLVAELQADVLRLTLIPDEPTDTQDQNNPPPPPAEGSISFEEEYRLMLYRHWTLYDSMLHSSFIATRLAIWREPGKRRLETMLAKMGIPLDECKQSFQWMSSEYKQALRARMEDFKDEFGLSDLMYGSFVRSVPFQPAYSAADIAYAVSSILVTPQPTPEGGVPANLDSGAAETWELNFERALDALEDVDGKALSAAIESAKTLQKLVVFEGVGLIEKRSVINAGKFAYAYIHQSSDQARLVHPAVLAKLAQFLIEGCLGADFFKKR